MHPLCAPSDAAAQPCVALRRATFPTVSRSLVCKHGPRAARSSYASVRRTQTRTRVRQNESKNMSRNTRDNIRTDRSKLQNRNIISIITQARTWGELLAGHARPPRRVRQIPPRPVETRPRDARTPPWMPDAQLIPHVQWHVFERDAHVRGRFERTDLGRYRANEARLLARWR